MSAAVEGTPIRAGLLTMVLAVCGLASVAPAAAQAAFFGGGSSSVVAADSARDAELDAMTATIASRLRCPVCRGQSVQESSSQLAREMQAVIRQKLGAGETPDEIEAFFLASYGDFILLKPRAEGLNSLVYILPIAGFLVAFLVIAVKLSRGRAAREGLPVAATGSTSPDASPELASADRAWLDAAIRGDS